MALRDVQIVISRQAVLLVTGVGVGLLTLSYVLGVQVGKQSAALRRPATKSVEEELKALPEPLVDQLKLFEAAEGGTPESRPRMEATLPPDEGKKAPAPKEERPGPPPGNEARRDPKPEGKVEPKASAKDDGSRWNLQLVATPDPQEADRVAAKAKAAGYATTVVKDKKLLKVRLVKALPRGEADAATDKLKEKGLKPFVTKAD